MPNVSEPGEEARRRGWRRAAGLFAIVLLTSVFSPGTLVAVPFLVLLAVLGLGDRRMLLVAAAAMILAVAGPRDALWFAERGWAVILGGTFAALSVVKPWWTLTSRALGAVLASVGAGATFFALRTGAWSAIDWSVNDRLGQALATWVEALTVLRQGEPVSPALVSAVYRTIELHASVFPAMIALESMAALGVVWWLYLRLTRDDDQGIGSIAGFRFNDHLVWVMIVGLVLVIVRVGTGMTRVGANLGVFMGALYAMRGMGVVAFVSGGLSLFGYAMFGLGLLFAAPMVLGAATVLGVADTWLDLRERVGAPAP